MTSLTRRLRARPGVTLAMLAVCLAAAQSGCAGGPRRLDIGPGSFTTLPVELRAGARTHMAVFTAPSAGWGVRLDLVRERFEAQEVFVTVTLPGPSQASAQVLVEHAVDTTVLLTSAVVVYARTQRAEGSTGAYERAAFSPSVRPSDTPPPSGALQREGGG